MKKLNKHMLDCAQAHKEHGDKMGFFAIWFAAKYNPAWAKRRYPDHVDAIDNAVAYARQEERGS